MKICVRPFAYGGVFGNPCRMNNCSRVLIWRSIPIARQFDHGANIPAGSFHRNPSSHTSALQYCTGSSPSSKIPEKSYYKILGLPIDCTQDEIKAAYYNLSKLHHPDITRKPEDALKFQVLTEAYEILGSYELRRKYDAGLLHDGNKEFYKKGIVDSPPIEHEDFYRSRLGHQKTYGTSMTDMPKSSQYNAGWLHEQNAQMVSQQKLEKLKRDHDRKTQTDGGVIGKLQSVLGLLTVIVVIIYLKTEGKK